MLRQGVVVALGLLCVLASAAPSSSSFPAGRKDMEMGMGMDDSDSDDDFVSFTGSAAEGLFDIETPEGNGVNEAIAAFLEVAQNGGDLIAGAFGLQQGGSGARRVNWDAAALDSVESNGVFPFSLMPSNFFNDGGPGEAAVRGIAFDQEVMVSRRLDTLDFSDIEPSYEQSLQSFSEPRLFAPFSSTQTPFHFFVAGTKIPAVVSGLGVVFNSVDLPMTTYIDFYDAEGEHIDRVYAPVGTFSFAGLAHSEGTPSIASAVVTTGNVPLSRGIVDQTSTLDGNVLDVVVMDDLLYGEPNPIV